MAASNKELAFMASSDKQKKRAQRAKAKAKQNRMGKSKAHVVHPLLANPLINDPFADFAFDLSTFDYKVIEENGFDPADFGDLFRAMYLSEDISLLALCLVFLQYPVLQLVVAEESDEAAADFIMSLLITYRAIFYEEDEDMAMIWLESDDFQMAYNQASLILQKRDSRT
ncbi:hypothetical protein PKB_4268 [Pseudomonas knackmussii B13]|uniref:Uncharacterized protein n=2 Tax=Pseudomonas knackmussii TaxID=65741 RepID=A0A024HMH0_PSEKB|nr:hypothetical protein PKB_4268 [Pseudomonas knackmussii B13]